VFGCHDLQDRQLNEINDLGQVATSDTEISLRMPINIFAFGGHSKRREILLNNIYGVDIDPQATEVAQVSLYLKLLEEETTASARHYQLEMGAALLPSLARNVACGNSLIEPDVLTPLESDLFEVSMEDERKLNPMNFAVEFPEIFKKGGGFDAIVGNPPWGAAFTDVAKDYLRVFFSDIHVRTPESFNYFIHRMYMLLRPGGALGAIVPSSFLTQHEFWRTRKELATAGAVKAIVNLGDGVFHKVTAPSCILVASKGKKNSYATVLDLRVVSRAELPNALLTGQGVSVEKIGLSSKEFALTTGGRASLMKKMAKLPTLKEVAEEVATGVSSGLDAAYVFTEEQRRELQIETAITKKLVIGGEIHRFRLSPTSTKRILYLTGKENINNYPHALKTLTPHKAKLKLRREAANGKIPWFALNWPRRKKLFEEPKILIRQTAPRIMAALDSDGWYCLKSGLVVQLPENSDLGYPYLLGLLNSKLIGYFYNELVGEQGRVFPEVKPVQLFKLPIRVPVKGNQADRELSARLNASVLQLCDVGAKKADAMTDRDLKFYETKCAQLERQIDAIVYQLYGLTKADIDAIEEAMPG
jgi:adenine-specific DNA-methyltransferase